MFDTLLWTLIGAVAAAALIAIWIFLATIGDYEDE
jgi:hypothetical protein